MDKMKVKLITHTDLDGAGCAILAKFAWNDMVDITYSEYNRIDDDVNKFMESEDRFNYDKFYITDISVSEDTAKHIDELLELDNNKDFITLIDHHKSAVSLNKYSWISISEFQPMNIDKKACGTSTFMRYLNMNEYFDDYSDYIINALEYFAEIIRQYDTWEWSKNSSEPEAILAPQLNKLFKLYIRNEFVDAMVQNILDETNPFPYEFTSTDNLRLNVLDTLEKKYIRWKFNEVNVITNSDSIKYGIVCADQYVSDLGHSIVDDKHVDVAVLISFNMKTQKAYISLRSNEQTDCSRIASKFGGGGHPQAAGIELDFSQLDKLFKYIRR